MFISRATSLIKESQMHRHAILLQNTVRTASVCSRNQIQETQKIPEHPNTTTYNTTQPPHIISHPALPLLNLPLLHTPDLTVPLLPIPLTNIALPPVLRKIRQERRVLLREVAPGHVRHEEVRDEDARHAADRGDDERPLLPEVRLDRRERLCADGCARLADRGGEAVAGAAEVVVMSINVCGVGEEGRGLPDGCGVGLGADEAEHVARAHVAEGLHEAVAAIDTVNTPNQTTNGEDKQRTR